MTSQFINRVELQGIIGSARKYTVGLRNGYQFTLAVNHTFRSNDGGAIIETCWIQCSCWESEKIDTSLLEKGKAVHLTGRIRSQRYTATDGEERAITEVVVNTLRPA